MPLSSRLYAPPESPLSRPRGAAPSLARVLVPVCLMILSERLGSNLITHAAFNASPPSSATLSAHQLSGFLSIGGSLVGVLAALIGGDGRAARHVLWVCLGLMVYAGIANLVHPTPWLNVGTPAIVTMTSVCSTLIAMGYALRTGHIRQSYLIIALVYGMWFVSWLTTVAIRALTEDVSTLFLAGVVATGIAIAAALMLVTPGTEPQLAEEGDPSPVRPSRSTAALVIVALGAFAGVCTVRYLGNFLPESALLHLSSPPYEARRVLRTAYRAIPSVICFVVLILAAWRWWRPSLVAVAGMGLAAIGAVGMGVLAAPSISDGPSPSWALSLSSGLTMDLGRRALYGAAWWVLLRQLVPRSRVVFWAALVFLLSELVEVLLYVAMYALEGELARRVTVLLGAAVMLGTAVTVLSALKRHQFLPLRPR